MSVAVASFAVYAASQVGTPGLANMALLANGARIGSRTALPFVDGFTLGKQLVIWPAGVGLMRLADRAPWLFEMPKWGAPVDICRPAWKVANLRLSAGRGTGKAPGFMAGLVVHPLNPWAWAMIVTGFTTFVALGTPALQATAIIAAILLACQQVLHLLWTFAGDRMAHALAGTPGEAYLMWTLAVLTVLSVFFVLFTGGTNP